MARKPSERSHSESVSEELNLTPIMAILVILIPILLYAFNFFEVKIQGVSAPKMGTGKSEAKKENEKKPLNLTVLITEKGFKLSQEEELTTEPEQPIPRRTFTDANGTQYVDYDYPRLYARLMAKKREWKKERTINIGADFNIPWHIIARTIDAARVQLEEEAYEDLESYATAKPKLDNEGNPMSLFDNVVFVVAD
jgi:biopolymer transport protein ExbD